MASSNRQAVQDAASPRDVLDLPLVPEVVHHADDAVGAVMAVLLVVLHDALLRVYHLFDVLAAVPRVKEVLVHPLAVLPALLLEGRPGRVDVDALAPDVDCGERPSIEFMPREEIHDKCSAASA